VIQKIARGDHPSRPAEATSLGLTDSVWTWNERCWNFQPSLRPSAEDVRRGVEIAHLAFIPKRAARVENPNAALDNDRNSLDALFADES
jgi:hypothetical protein